MDTLDTLRNVVAGESRDPLSGAWMDLVDPSTRPGPALRSRYGFDAYTRIKHVMISHA
ncbi:hypothetical protein [Microtetraspora malaysiensis]|uniref:hypothetical protein n=1 Tax=Microtetraspora malaysiensis TaxID=161358 RepID=UPI003D90AD85